MAAEQIVLSILICSLTEREQKLARLKRSLDAQLTPEVEVIVDVDNREVTVGAKRNRLLDTAKGEYVAYVDDDDAVVSDYVRRVLEGCRQGLDCCSLLGVMYYDGKLDAHFHHSIRNEAWARAESGLYLRPPNHLNAVRREIASSIRFPELNVGEDRDYCLRLKEHLKTEAEIPKPIYRYNYSSYKSTTHG